MSLPRPKVQEIRLTEKNNKQTIKKKGVNFYFKERNKKYSIEDIEAFANQCQTGMNKKGKKGYVQITIFSDGISGSTKQLTFSSDKIELHSHLRFSDYFDAIEDIWDNPEEHKIDKFSIVVVETI